MQRNQLFEKTEDENDDEVFSYSINDKKTDRRESQEDFFAIKSYDKENDIDLENIYLITNNKNNIAIFQLVKTCSYYSVIAGIVLYYLYIMISRILLQEAYYRLLLIITNLHNKIAI